MKVAFSVTILLQNREQFKDMEKQRLPVLNQFSDDRMFAA